MRFKVEPERGMRESFKEFCIIAIIDTLPLLQGCGTALGLAVAGGVVSGLLVTCLPDDINVGVSAATGFMMTGGTWLIVRYVEIRQRGKQQSTGPTYNVLNNGNGKPVDLNAQEEAERRGYHVEAAPAWKFEARHNLVNPAIPDSIPPESVLKLAWSILYNSHAKFTGRYWSGSGRTYSQTQWKDLRHFFLRHGIAEVKGRTLQTGLVLTGFGRAWMQEVINQFGNPPLRTRRREK